MNRRLGRVLLGGVALLFGVHGLTQPMAFVVPMAILALLMRRPLTAALAAIGPSLAFVGSGLAFGLATEGFAILGNTDRADQDKILMHARPGVDLFFGVFSYGLPMLAWLPLVKCYRFSLREVFLLTAAYGICAEQGGRIVLIALSSPWPGLPLAGIIGSIYGAFPTLAYMLTQQRFAPGRPEAGLRHHVLACFLLFLQWAVFGLVVLPALKSLPGITR